MSKKTLCYECNGSGKRDAGRIGKRVKRPALAQSSFLLTYKKPAGRSQRSAVRGGACGFEFGGFKVRTASRITAKIDSNYDYADELSEARVCLARPYRT